ncbi:MAG: M20/M25/M40 family metallo-hydrolase [Alsobacter sp.]
MTSRAVDAAAVDAFVDDRRDDLLSLLGALVAAPSFNPPGDTRAVAAIVASRLAAAGLAHRMVARDPTKPNVIASFEGGRPGPHLVFNVHLDTIHPGEESDWSVPLTEMTRRGDRLYGLGIGNMKGAVAAQLLAVEWLFARRQDLAGRVTFTGVADETVFGPDGAEFLLEAGEDILGDAVICGEGPGALGLALAEKGWLWIAVEATARTAQGMLARPRSSAITRLAAALVEIDGWNALRAEPPEVIADVARGGPEGLRLSVNAGTVQGGLFVSQSATRAVAELDFRIPPGLTVADIEGRMSELCARSEGLSFRRLKGGGPNWTAAGEPVVAAVAAAHAAVTGEAARPVVRLPGSDASRWRRRGVPAVCYGPQADIVSGVDDHVIAEDVVTCAKVYARAALSLLSEAHS